MKRIASILLVLALCIGFSLPVMAADNSAVDAKVLELEKKYNLTITYDTEAGGTAAIGTGTLHTLDMVLEKITPGVVRQVSAYVKTQTGKPLVYSFVLGTGNLDLPPDVEAHGAFYEETGTIEIFLPASSGGTYSSGDNPLAMAHEFAHALEWTLRSKYGAQKLATDWKALNGGASYNDRVFDGSGSYSTTTFVSLYATSSYDEDFAETFAHAVVRDRAGLGFYHLLTGKDGSKTPLGRKIDFLAALLPQSLESTDALVKQLKKVYTTPIYLQFKNMQLTGVYMQYIGYSYPRYVLRGIMSAPEVNDEVASSAWVSEIGGWYVVSTTGRYYLVYPGGVIQQYATALNIAV